MALVIFGVFLTLALLEAVLRLGGFILLSSQELKNRVSLLRKPEYRILCLGESTTQDQYPRLLEETLNKRAIGVKFSVIDKGIGGTETKYIVSRLDSYVDSYHPDMVITMMGINDSGLHVAPEPAEGSAAAGFFRSLRVYKLARLLGLHIASTIGRTKACSAERAAVLSVREPTQEGPQQPAAEEEAGLKKAVEADPQDAGALIRLGRFYRHQERFSEAEACYNKAIELEPDNENGYFELGWLYRHQPGRFSEAEEPFDKAIELYEKAIVLNPESPRPYFTLGGFCHQLGRFSEAEKCYKDAIELYPQNERLYVELGKVYKAQGRTGEAEVAWKKVIEMNPRNEEASKALELLYLEKGDAGLAGKFAEGVREAALDQYSQDTIDNHRKLKSILDKRGVAYVCMQYPLRPVEPLKKIFEGDEQGIIFIDNERIFKEAIAKHGYAYYFWDMFADDFGHCTDKGNRLLAEHIADVILKEAFGR